MANERKKRFLCCYLGFLGGWRLHSIASPATLPPCHHHSPGNGIRKKCEVINTLLKPAHKIYILYSFVYTHFFYLRLSSDFSSPQHSFIHFFTFLRIMGHYLVGVSMRSEYKSIHVYSRLSLQVIFIFCMYMFCILYMSRILDVRILPQVTQFQHPQQPFFALRGNFLTFPIQLMRPLLWLLNHSKRHSAVSFSI